MPQDDTPKIPNAKTMAAIAEAEEMIHTGGTPRFKTIDALFEYLGAQGDAVTAGQPKPSTLWPATPRDERAKLYIVETKLYIVETEDPDVQH